MKKFLSEHGDVRLFGSIAVIVGFGAFGGLGYYFVHQTQSELATLTTDMNAQKTLFEGKTAALEQALTSLQSQNEYLANTLLNEQQKTGLFIDRVSNISDSVSVLTKLVQTDPELLKKYSKNYFLNEHYVPFSLTKIDPVYVYTAGRTLEIHSSVYPKLKAMFDAAALENISLKVDSAYRSFGTQAVLKANYRLTYGAGTANQFSAEQGYSEHQLGTTVDFTSDEIKGALGGFDTTKAYTWLTANAYKYGFILSYPKNNTYYQYEPWHWRFVGVGLAAKLHQDGMNFYDADQRVIDQYLVDIFN